MAHRRHFWLMAFLSGLFTLRVAAQLVQAIWEVRFLPPFAAWQGSTLPYPVLLGSQAAIVAALAVVLRVVYTGAIAPRSWMPTICFVAGGVYFVVMAFRLIGGLTFLSEYAWFAKIIPALFHVILSLIILTLGHYLWKLGKQGRGESA